MFVWCSYCQHLIGEAPPLDSYALSHGVCRECHDAMGDEFRLEPSKLAASRLLKRLVATASTAGDPELRELLEQLRRSEMRPSDMLLGVVQPALYEIGRRWERGETSVDEEHRFTEFCHKVYEQFAAPPPADAQAPSLLLALTPGNSHDLGVHFLERLAKERGVSCRVLPTGTIASEIVGAVVREQPSLFGLSVSTSSMLESAKGVLRLCEQAVPEQRALVGGYAMRRLPPGKFEHATVVRRVDEFIAELTAVQSLAP